MIISHMKICKRMGQYSLLDEVNYLLMVMVTGGVDKYSRLMLNIFEDKNCQKKKKAACEKAAALIEIIFPWGRGTRNWAYWAKIYLI